MDKEGSNQEIILDLLKKIESNRKKLRAKVSVILKQVEEFVLNKKPKFSEQEIRLLFLADGQKKLSGKDKKHTSSYRVLTSQRIGAADGYEKQI